VAPLIAGVVREADGDESRVALVPADVGRLIESGVGVVVESGAGRRACFGDEVYAGAGADVMASADLYARSDVVLGLGSPSDAVFAALRPGTILLGLLGLRGDGQRLGVLADRGLTALSFDGLPRTVSRAQSMDALTSQANVAGYKPVLVAANAYGRLLPMQMTAAGTNRPARVLVLGAGVAGLQAIGTARRLGAQVSAYDVRPAAHDEIASVGARFVDLGDAFGGVSEGGYARELGEEERRALPEALAPHVARADIVITTAQVPGRLPPLLVTDEAVKAMASGSVVVDLAARTDGGNVASSRAGRTVVTDNGVTVIGAPNLAAQVATAASEAYSRNVSALVRHVVRDGAVKLAESDEIIAGVLAVRDGRIAPTWKVGAS
jgi:H+-translocating NAD(P) transhydrogenase subunit alpha